MLIMHRKLLVINIFVEIDANSVLELRVSVNVPLCASTLVEKFVLMRVNPCTTIVHVFLATSPTKEHMFTPLFCRCHRLFA